MHIMDLYQIVVGRNGNEKVWIRCCTISKCYFNSFMSGKFLFYQTFTFALHIGRFFFCTFPKILKTFFFFLLLLIYVWVFDLEFNIFVIVDRTPFQNHLKKTASSVTCIRSSFFFVLLSLNSVIHKGRQYCWFRSLSLLFVFIIQKHFIHFQSLSVVYLTRSFSRFFFLLHFLNIVHSYRSTKKKFMLKENDKRYLVFGWSSIRFHFEMIWNIAFGLRTYANGMA